MWWNRIVQPQVKRAVALLNKLVMVANRANNNKKQRYQQANPMAKYHSQSQDLNDIKHLEGEQLPTNSAENLEDNHPIHQKALALPRVSYVLFLILISRLVFF